MALGSVLGRIPGYGGFAARREQHMAEDESDLQQARAEIGLMAALEQRKLEQANREALTASGGDPEKATQILLSRGNVGAAAKLEGLAKLAQQNRQAEETAKGLSAIMNPQPQAAPQQNQIVPGPNASVMASGVAAPVAAPQANPLQEVERLRKMIPLYARNPTVVAQLQAQIARIEGQVAAADDRKAAASSAADLRREIATGQQTAAAERQRENLAAQEREHGRDRALRRDLAIQQIEARRRDKLDAATGKQDEAKLRVTGNLKALSDYYDELDKLGAAVDTKKGGMANLSARVRASGPGQLVGGALGTEEQSYRNRINQMRPLLLQEIRQASAMGARGLDSNKELEFYLQAATSPERDIQANRAALQVLENAYGLSSRVEGVSQEQIEALRTEFKGGAPKATAPVKPRFLGFE